ncbi:MAG: 1-acyl-sn-glycerol-3-phosphate acyltransferase [Opitutales bacterium]|nr:1-acyl-sn-glycerol-3-phosphate acyltransferase [Opitutales bacterium]MCH8539149.1 1-acyl-sn-glycerol-3-phosphate acyltransferase [Opitutales bacterium]
MLSARPSAPARWLFSLYLRQLFRRTFHRIVLRGHFEALKDNEAYPLIFYSNHQSWWDGLLEWRLVEHLRGDLRLMMAEKNLRQFPFFRRVGVFGVDLEDSRDRAKGLLHAIKLLRTDTPRRVLVVFPQGELHPPHEPFHPFLGGLETLLRKSPQAKAYPLGKVLRFTRYQRPEVLFQLGKPYSAGATLEELQAGLQETLQPGNPPCKGPEIALLPPHPSDLKRAGT